MSDEEYIYDSSDYEDHEDEDDGDFDEPDPDPGRKSSVWKRKSKTNVVARCSSCTKTYCTMEGFRKHLDMHIVGDLMQHAPGRIAVREECHRVLPTVLTNIQELKPRCGDTETICNIARKLQASPPEKAGIFVDHVATELYSCLPDMSVTDMGKFHVSGKVHSMLVDKRAVLMTSLKVALDMEFPGRALEWFLTDISRRLAAAVQAMFLRCLREPHQELLGSYEDRDDVEDLNFQQSLHYIGGSSVKSVMRKAFNHLSNESWKCIYDCMSKKFLVTDGLTGPGEDIELWTDSVSRGGLKKINHKVWVFIMGLSDILKQEESSDGSILHETVFKTVCSSDVLMFLWNDITENSLKGEVDLFLLRTFCEFFTNTWLRGVILRRKNAIPKLSRDKVALRSRLSS